MVFANPAAMRQPLRHLPRIQGQCGNLSWPQAPATAPANIPKSVVDSLMAAMAAKLNGRRFRSLFGPLTPPSYGNGSSEIRRGLLLAGLIATSSNATAVLGETLNSQPAETEFCKQPVSKQWLQAAKPISLIHRGRMGASQVGACAIEQLRPQEGLRPLTDS